MWCFNLWTCWRHTDVVGFKCESPGVSEMSRLEERSRQCPSQMVIMNGYPREKRHGLDRGSAAFKSVSERIPQLPSCRKRGKRSKILFFQVGGFRRKFEQCLRNIGLILGMLGAGWAEGVRYFAELKLCPSFKHGLGEVIILPILVSAE